MKRSTILIIAIDIRKNFRKKFQSPYHTLLEFFHATPECNCRAITPENQKFCSMYMHFVG